MPYSITVMGKEIGFKTWKSHRIIALPSLIDGHIGDICDYVSCSPNRRMFVYG